MGRTVIEAAGGVVWRPGDRGLEVLLIHRPKYDDWSFPKGKLERRERPLDAALREVREETGFRCGVGGRLPSARYVDRKGRAKRVRYWVMHVLGGSFSRNHEVDRITWMDVEAALGALTYRHDALVLDELGSVLAHV